MRLEDHLTVSADPQRVWDHLQDVAQLVPCMPGAELVDTIDERSWRGRMKVKLGPVALTFEGVVELADVDHEARRMLLRGSGKDHKGKGAASADVEVQVGAVEGGAAVSVVQELKIQGQIAQFGRGMMQDISAQMTGQFATCLEAALQANASEAVSTTDGSLVEAGGVAGGDAATAVREPQPVSVPVQGFRLLLRSLTRALGRGLRRLLGRR